jgi:hypothetical protein
MIVLITELKETKVSSDPREKENKNADMKYELTFRKYDESEQLWQALYKRIENACDTTEKEKYTELMKKIGSVLERE